MEQEKHSFAWVGPYDEMLTVTPEAVTYQFTSHAVWQRFTPKHFPIVRATRNRIEVDLGSEPVQLPWIAHAYVYVRWGWSDFLVPEELMQEFCFFANDRSNWNSRRSPFPSRRALAYAVGATDPIPLPNVPPEFEQFLLRNEVEAAVFESTTRLTGEMYKDDPIVEASVRIDAGSKSGLLPGMSLFFSELDGWGEGKIVEVDGDTSRAVFDAWRIDADRPPQVTTGSRVSTSSPARR